MAEFLDVLKAPQSRRIIEVIFHEEVSIETLIKRTKLSENSIRLHLQPLLKAKLILKSSNGFLRLNLRKFIRNTEWFNNLLNAE